MRCFSKCLLVKQSLQSSKIDCCEAMKPPLTIESFIVYFLFALYIPQVSRGLVFRFFCETCISSFPFQCGKTFAFHRRLCLQLRWLKLLWRRFQAFLWAYGYFMRSQFSGQTSWNFIYFGHLVRIHWQLCALCSAVQSSWGLKWD